jgi:hypothetical protein
MCNTKSVLAIGVMVAAAYTGGAAAAAYGGAETAAAGASTITAAQGAAIGMTAAGSAISMDAQAAQARTQEKLLDRQADVGKAQADDALARGARTADRYADSLRQFEGQQRSAMAAGGGVLNSGSNDAMLSQTEKIGQMDLLTIQHNAALEAWGYKNQSDTSSYQAKLTRTKADYDAMGSILTGGSQAYGIYKRG